MNQHLLTDLSGTHLSFTFLSIKFLRTLWEHRQVRRSPISCVSWWMPTLPQRRKRKLSSNRHLFMFNRIMVYVYSCSLLQETEKLTNHNQSFPRFDTLAFFEPMENGWGSSFPRIRPSLEWIQTRLILHMSYSISRSR